MTQSFDESSKHQMWTDEYNEYCGKYLSDTIEEESSLSSSGKMSYMFMPHEKLRTISQKLDMSQSVETRYQVLMMLSQIPQSDVVTSEHWSSLKKCLGLALGDENDRISDISLKLLSKMHIINNAHATCEVFTCLTNHLTSIFQDSNHAQGQLDDGLNVAKKSNEKMVKKFRLLCEFLHEIPSYWVRYPERFVGDILESSISLLSLGNNHFGLSSFNAIISPLHYLALLDPKASWFKKWMHGYYSRKPVVEQLKRHPNLLIDTIQHCLEFASISKSLLPFDVLEDDDEYVEMPFETESKKKDSNYSYQQLDYIYFVHSLCLLGRLLLYKDSRELFPVSLPNTDDDVSTTDLVVAFIEIMSANYPNFTDSYHPGELVVGVLKEIASDSVASQELLCKDSVANALLLPLQTYLEGIAEVDEESSDLDKNTLLYVADVLACLAASDCGRRLLLYGEKHDRWQRNRLAPAHVIIEFTKKALNGQLPGKVTLPHMSVSAFVFVCRQLYNGCEGLLVTSHYGLHQCIADAWRSSCTGEYSVEDDIRDESRSILPTCLIDNLLNFAGTPKGVLLLQQSGAMIECVSYMYERYKKKLQVSKCEKFGYGVMVTQIAATCPGIVALETSGFVTSLLHDLWFCLEGGEDDNKIISPRIKENAIEKTLHKVMLNLLNILSSFPAVFELIVHQPLSSTSPELRDDNVSTSINKYPYPTTIVEIIERLALIDSEDKVRLLLNFEEAHLYGLRLLNVMCSSLDTFLLLQTQYNIQEVLLQLQVKSLLPSSSAFVIDACSMERNHILVKTYFVGGPTERNLPPRTLSDDSNEVSCVPMFSTYPPPLKPYIFTDSLTKLCIQDDDLSRHLRSETPRNEEWREKCCHMIINVLTSTEGRLKNKVLGNLLEQLVDVQSSNPEEAIFPLIDFSGSETILMGVDLSELQHLGVKLAIRYGSHLKLIQSNAEISNNLVLLLKKAKCFLQGQQHKSFESSINFLNDYYPGFDWFASTIFLIMSGDEEKSWNFLYKFSCLVSSVYLWTPRLHASVHLPTPLMVSGIPPIYSSVCHNIELVLQAEVPLVFSAFRISGYTPSQICQHWLSQCFWNYLDWEDICSYVIICLAMGIDYQVYLCVAIFHHLQRDILLETQRQSLALFLKESPILNFEISEYVEFMIDLERRYRSIVLKDLQNITKA
ncbi:protein broad-minded-like isoform X2 [Dendronephthya gigantea]|nr:protein broad-minded-like isoform X2 [Dendronephthya gigantea]